MHLHIFCKILFILFFGLSSVKISAAVCATSDARQPAEFSSIESLEEAQSFIVSSLLKENIIKATQDISAARQNDADRFKAMFESSKPYAGMYLKEALQKLRVIWEAGQEDLSQKHTLMAQAILFLGDTHAPPFCLDPTPHFQSTALQILAVFPDTPVIAKQGRKYLEREIERILHLPLNNGGSPVATDERRIQLHLLEQHSAIMSGVLKATPLPYPEGTQRPHKTINF